MKQSAGKVNIYRCIFIRSWDTVGDPLQSLPLRIDLVFIALQTEEWMLHV